MNTAELSHARQRKSSYSANDNACVEVAHLDDGRWPFGTARTKATVRR
jgi:Domain of unknown function (DUF397)